MNGLGGDVDSLQILTLALQGEVFAIEARHVREILDTGAVTEVPGAVRCLNGLMNVRGKVVPLLDLSLALGLIAAPATPDSRIVVVELDCAGVQGIVGLRADRVYEMTELAPGTAEAAPQTGMRLRSSFVRCVGRTGSEFLIVLDLASILGAVKSMAA